MTTQVKLWAGAHGGTYVLLLPAKDFKMGHLYNLTAGHASDNTSYPLYIKSHSTFDLEENNNYYAKVPASVSLSIATVPITVTLETYQLQDVAGYPNLRWSPIELLDLQALIVEAEKHVTKFQVMSATGFVSLVEKNKPKKREMKKKASNGKQEERKKKKEAEQIEVKKVNDVVAGLTGQSATKGNNVVAVQSGKTVALPRIEGDNKEQQKRVGMGKEKVAKA